MSHESQTPPKKILVTAYDFYPQTGGVATYAWELAESLGRQGLDVLVVTKSREASPKASPYFKVKTLPLKNTGLMSFPFLAMGLKPLLKSWQPDKIICTLWMPGAIAAVVAKKMSEHKPSIFAVVHAMEIVDSKKSLKGWLRRRLHFLKNWTFKNLEKVFCVSTFSQNLLLKETGIAPEKTFVVHNGVNPVRFAQPQAPSESHNRFEHRYPILLTVARLVPHKGIDTLLQGLPHILKDFPKTQLLIGGTGPDRRRLEAITDALGVRNAVEFLGHIPDNELPQLYALADLFALISREVLPQVEGFGLVFLEAAACGTPSLGGDSGGIPDAILDGKTGWLVDPESPKAVAQKVSAIFKNPKTAESVGAYAKSYTLENRTWEHTSKLIAQHLFEDL